MEYEWLYRFAVFAVMLMVMGVLEFFIPKREMRIGRQERWVTNVGLAAMNSLLLRVFGASTVPLLALAAALYAEEQQIGLLNQYEMPFVIELVVSLFILDFAIYFQHWASHKFPILWRIHKVHHSDQDLDVTTAVRFHPIEIGLSMFYKVGLVFLFGFDAISVLLFEIILNACALFHHSNVALPGWLDRPLRMVFVTPDMHRVHHSVIRGETDSNYGFSLAIWDRLLGTYVSQPAAGHKDMKIGLPENYDSEDPRRFSWSLAQPFLPKDDPPAG